MIQISENADRLSKEFKNRYSDISWQMMKGMRNRIVHEYGGVDLKIVFDAVKVDIPAFYETIKSLV